MLTTLMVLTSVLAATSTDFDHGHGQLNTVLSHYVADGLVDYAGLKADRAPLDAYLEAMGTVPLAAFQRWSKDEQLAFLINVYNASTLKLIIDGYPVESIKSLGSLVSSPWNKKSVQLFGKQISLDTLEHEIIRKNYVEPRVHFALVCAALGCPILRNEAYVGERLGEQLKDQTRVFLHTDGKNRVDVEKKQLLLSPIFKWYRKDFEASAETLAGFVAPYLEVQLPAGSLADFDIRFTDYDWALNDQHGKKS